MAGLALKYPVPGKDGQTITELTFRRLKAKDMRRLGAAPNDEERGLIMISCAADLPMEVIDEMDVDDVVAATEALSDFLPQTPSDPQK